MHPFLEVGYHLHTNNWYTTLPLYKYLHQHGTLACGTIRSNWNGLLQQVKNAKLKKGEVMAIPWDELLALKFKDKKDVYMLSTIHDHSMLHRQDRHHKNQHQTSLYFSLQQIYGWCGSHKTTDAAIWNSQKYIKWYKKVAMHFNQLALFWLASLCIRRIIKPFLAFEHDIIIYCKSTFWTQKWRSWPAQGGTHCKVHWVTLYRPHPSNRGKAETPKTVQGLLQEGTSQRKSLSVFWLSKQPCALLLTLLWTVPHKTHLHDLICVKITLPLINIAQSERVMQKKVKIFLYYLLF